MDLLRLIAAIGMVESSGNPSAVNGECVGLLQMKPIMVHEANRICALTGSPKRFMIADRLDAVKSTEMADIIITHYLPRLPDQSVESAALFWRWGFTGMKAHGKDEWYPREVAMRYAKTENNKTKGGVK